MGLEIMEQVPDADAIVIPVGGAGLIAGIAVAAKAMKPDIMIIVSLLDQILIFKCKITYIKAAESDKAAGFHNSMKIKKPTLTPSQSTLADGLAVPLVGFNSFATAAPLVDKVNITTCYYLHYFKLKKSWFE